MIAVALVDAVGLLTGLAANGGQLADLPPVYPSSHSDVLALLAFEHQMRMMNVITRAGWDARMAADRPDAADVVSRDATELVDYLLFVDEAPL